MKSASEQVMEEVQRLIELYKGEELSITITGHSLGVALMLLTAYQIGENLASNSSNASIAVFSIGGSRVGNHDFKQRQPIVILILVPISIIAYLRSKRFLRRDVLTCTPTL